MAISTRDLEEDEVKIDNLLNKILHSCRLIEELNNQIGSIKKIKILDKDYVLERVRKIDILIKTIMNIAILADDIDVIDESITEDLEKNLKEGLGVAIKNIKDVNKFLEKEGEEEKQA